MPIVEVSQLSKRFKSLVALDGVNFSVDAGSCLAIMGANGAGKSTLLKILAGLVLPTSGSASVAGEDPSRAGNKWRRQIGYACGERPGFYDRLTAWQNLEFFAALFGLFGALAKARIQQVCEMAGVTAMHQPYQELSTGMKQRLLIARALIHDPQVFLLDEPTRSLDPEQVKQFLQLMKAFKGQGRTVIVTTHRRQDAEAMADSLILLDRGRIQSETTQPQMAAIER